MANSYSTSLRLIIQTTGENSGTWGNYTNTNLGTLLEQAITGIGAIAVSGSSDYTLTVTNGASDESRNAILNVTGTLTAAINVICPAVTKAYTIKNATTGGYAITLKTASGTGISVPNGATMMLYCNGTNVVEGITNINSLTSTSLALSGNLSVAGTVSGAGFSTYLASPPAIGGTAAAAGAFTTLSASSTVSGSGFSTYLASPPAIGGTAAAAGTFTTLGCTALTASADSSFTSTGYLKLPVGTTAQRPGTGVNGEIRYNSDLTRYEGYNGTDWGSLGGGATGGGTDQIFMLNGQTVNTSYSVPSGQNAGSFGAITIASGATVTVPAGSTWTIV